ncbi:glycine/betaine ABC transporter substrate-binding protein [Limosilactobacillus sp. STM2_1]|uniref:Glycine/betaine ABC transporter substrate-binding protein n=1 Tax=Limosilactobacillus rudii TaxID=2759755 RepID=A0A7W3YNT9_9LACO|nr:glycine betaine ABC transporter substrate-binding protein [Limosilactobacillus rudii]MBB1079298.1 glycine/betaine ABC transporter substrate-binding protein [Limosilactobacillus rudii]MBB1098508.1 glycine/betaine ABC transporter substrate-binding protein [Limosilactobacillus rudii]MCD7135517.1 glycine/betaine ABC transporter substrate-binding protein [Limosilactobacillus rudii]
MRVKKIMAASLLAAGTLLLGTIMPTVASAANNKPIIVGSKNVSESKTVSEIYALSLEHAGYKVTRKPNIANNVIFSSTQKGQIDVYPDYTGTIVETYLKKKGTGKSASEMAKIAHQGVAKYGLTTFNYAPGDNRQGIAMPTKIARKDHITNLSQLQKKANKIRFASQGEFEKRADGLPEMNKVYGKFNFKSIKDYDVNLLYRIMEQGKAEAAPVSTTDGQLATSKFTLIKDNKNIWPPYNLVPVVNKKAAKNYPKMEKTLNAVDAKLTTKQLVALNKKVNVNHQNYKTVAQNWYNQNMK